MTEWGFGVNSLVEYEPNPVFAGRNFNAGEIIELVLRRRDGSFLPWNFLLYVTCHELAHIKVRAALSLSPFDATILMLLRVANPLSRK